MGKGNRHRRIFVPLWKDPHHTYERHYPRRRIRHPTPPLDLGGQQARISRFNTNTGIWETVYYPLEAAESAAGGWVGLSELVHVGDSEFAVVERDNQGNADAVIKRIYSFSIDGVTFKPEAEQASFDIVTKSLVRDIYRDLAATGGAILEKVEGMSIQANGDVLIVNDNDGVDDSNGETQLINLGELFE